MEAKAKLRYARYLVQFNRQLEASGLRCSSNALRDQILKIPKPMSYEEYCAFLIDAIDPLAERGFKFMRGRKKGTGGPIRKWIARQLAKGREMKNAELWAAIKARPPRGWQVQENRLGKYLDGPTAKDHMTYGRFSNVAKEERDKLKG